MILTKHDMNKKFGVDDLWKQYQEDFNNFNEILKESNYAHYKDELIDLLTSADMSFGEEEPFTLIGYKRCDFIKAHVKDFCNDSPTRCDAAKCEENFRKWLNEEYKEDE